MSTTASDGYKDKIEVSLDGRQVFYLFFGGAIIACMVFVLGVMVGKRVESRAHQGGLASASARHDPLAALDRLDADGEAGLSFRQALTSGATPASDVDKTIAEMERLRTQSGKPAAPAPAPIAPAAAVAIAPAPVVAKPVVAPVVVAPKPVVAAAAVAPAAPSGKGKFTLQLSAFQAKGEAQEFMRGVKAAGFDAYLTEAQVDGKGTYYRVRLGSYGTYEDAVEAKTSFEQKQKKIAYVTRL